MLRTRLKNMISKIQEKRKALKRKAKLKKKKKERETTPKVAFSEN